MWDAASREHRIQNACSTHELSTDINSYQTLEDVVMNNKLCLRGHNDQQTLLVSLGNGREHVPPSLSKDKRKYYKSSEK
jgi:hypothetical protein